MIDNIETYSCEEQGCGRKFQKFDDLIAHYKRRHENLFEKYNKKEDKSKKLLNELYEKISNMEKESQIMIGYEDLENDFVIPEISENYEQEKDDNIMSNEQSAYFDNLTKNEENKIENYSVDIVNEKFDEVRNITYEMIGLGSNSDWEQVDEVNINIYID
jgi:hypothetical protein